ncbi:hypothetical protein EV385_3160 [Krasilnikovia cinnamomea]|uniref:Secreted protein n=1 Tax=Krasilnikovia cinnamomea TaxID=349313 RepID=A0A4Q7ZLX9_9ACTN|nr:hypothetical protein [Krasilnikovia cinnamomea]RZU51345.1 hypothetical protein EV385_3160 [Krasilnikovia cinnamomea]
MRVLVTLAAAAATAALLPSPAQAESAGRTTFFTRADFTGAAQSVPHASCTSMVTVLRGRFLAVDNRPPVGCQVQVYANATPVWVTLCVGRSELPREVQLNPEVRSVRGTAALCH